MVECGAVSAALVTFGPEEVTVDRIAFSDFMQYVLVVTCSEEWGQGHSEHVNFTCQMQSKLVAILNIKHEVEEI